MLRRSSYEEWEGDKDKIRMLERQWKKHTWMRLLSGITLEPSMANRGVERYISSLPDSPVSHGVMLASEKESKMSDGSGMISSELLAKYDLASSSWKTSQALLVVEDFLSFLENFPKSGMMLNGCLYQRPKLEPTINENESGFWPTPTLNGNYNRKGASPKSGDGLATAVKMWPTPSATPRGPASGREVTEGGQTVSNETGIAWGMTLETAVKHYPTPMGNTRDAHPKNFKRGNPNLASVVNQYPTPNTVDAKGGTRRGSGQKQLCHQVGGQLNPLWVEWLMNFPIGWTGLEPVGMESFLLWEQSLIGSLNGGSHSELLSR